MNIEPGTLNFTYTVLVDDNFHYMDESYRYKLGDFPNCEAATSACKSIVNNFLSDHHKPNMTADALFTTYKNFGEDPYIVSDDPTCKFSAWTYAEARCNMICRGK